MNCETVRNRLLTLPDPGRPPADVHGHVGGCAGCRTYLTTLTRLDGWLAAVPVPASSAVAKAELLDRVLAPGPIITPRVVVPRRDSTAALRALAGRTGRWTSLAGLAAGVLVAVGVWLAGGRTPPPLAQAAPPHQLLKDEVGRIVALRGAETPAARAGVLADLAADLRGEAKAIYLAAGDEEMRKLAGLYEKTVTDGVVRQADKVSETTPAAELKGLFDALAAKLDADERAAVALAGQAPPTSKPGLDRIAQAARAGRAKLRATAARLGAT